MKKVNLSMEEEKKFEIISNLVYNKGNKKAAALKLGISVRQVDRLVQIFLKKGKEGFIHGNRGRTPKKAYDDSFRLKIINLYKDKYYNCNFSHFKDLLESRENISVSYNFIYKTLTKESIYSPRIRKTTRRKLKKKELLLKKENKNKSEKDIEVMVSHLLSLEDAHPRQERPKNFGELIEMDGSIHNWFGTEKCCLHLAIDKCTGTIVGAYFQKQETLYGYYTIFKQILQKYGIPAQFKTDNRTVFNYESLSKEKRTPDKDVLTQFGYACKTLGTDLITTSVSQAKGSIERANQTFQDRLVNELKIENITDMNKANSYLVNKFIPDFNKRFAENFKKYPSVFEKSPAKEKINYTLAILSTRKIDNGNSIKFKNKYYQPVNKNSKLQCFKSGTECLVIEAFDGTLLATIDNNIYSLKEVKKHKTVSVEFDKISKEEQIQKTYIPTMTHLWQVKAFKEQLENAHKHHTYA